MPLVIGHEFSGVITAVGDGVTGWTEGDRVAVEPIYRCGHCAPCRAGNYNICAADRLPRADVRRRHGRVHRGADRHAAQAARQRLAATGRARRADVGGVSRRDARRREAGRHRDGLRGGADRHRAVVRVARQGCRGRVRRRTIADEAGVDRGTRCAHTGSGRRRRPGVHRRPHRRPRRRRGVRRGGRDAGGRDRAGVRRAHGGRWSASRSTRSR